MYRGSRLAHMLIDKEESDNRLLVTDKSKWYLVDHSKLSPLLHDKWHQFYLDREAEEFLEQSLNTSNSIGLQFYYAFASTILSMMMTKTSINGVLDRGGMFIFSTDQFREFMQISEDWQEDDKYMLDLGAGDGRVTSVIAQFYKNVNVTEASQVMGWRLSRRGYTVIPIDKWTEVEGPVHLISALNLLDRHFDPNALLRDLHSVSSRTGALILIAIVLPVRQYVEFHPNGHTTRADSKINVEGTTLEEQASSLVDNVFIPAGFELLRWGKLPYLCEGDSNRAYYQLDDAVFLLRAVEAHETNSVQQDATSSNIVGGGCEKEL